MYAEKRQRKPAVERARVRMPERVTEKWSANLHHRKPEGSAARMIRGGLVGPKGKARAEPMDNRLIILYHDTTVRPMQEAAG